MAAESGNSFLVEVLRQCSPETPLDSAWTQEQWCEAFSFLLLGHPDDRHALLEHQDDLLWFVAGAAALSPNTPRVTLRRNTAPVLPAELRPGGASFASVDWRLSACLNLVVQAKYVLTVIKCRQDALLTVARDFAPSQHHWHNPHHAHHPNAIVTQRRVYASPMAADVNLEGTKAGRPPQPCYPDVSFAVDNHEDAFGDMVLSQPGDCYCVLLHVHTSHAARSRPASHDAHGSAGQPGRTPGAILPPQPQALERRSTLFSAYVTREQVADYLHKGRSQRSPLPSLLNLLLGAPRRAGGSAAAAGQRERVIMAGPGGIGRAEAVATALPPGSAPGAAPHAGGGGDAAKPALQLSLMWMSLPADALARAVLGFACSS